MPSSNMVVWAGTTAQRLASTAIMGRGDLGLDTDTGRYVVGDGVSAMNLLPFIKGTRIDAGETFMAKRDAKYGSAVAYVAGDSTGAITTRWPRRLINLWASDNTDAQVDCYDLWDDTAKTYTHTVIQAGTSGGTVGIRSRHAWGTTVAELVGATLDTGQVWTGSAANASGDFSITGSGLLRSSDTTTAGLLADSGSAGERAVSLTGITSWSTAAATPASVFRLYNSYVDSSNNTYGYVNISTAGIVTWGVTKTIAGTPTSTAGVGAILTASTAGQTITSLTVTRVGTTVTFTVITGAGTFSQNLTLTSPELAAIVNATKDGFQGGPLGWVGTPGGSNGFKVDVTAAAAPLLQLTMYNGSVTGSTLASVQLNQLAIQCPVTPDLVFINSVHNYNAASAATYLAALDQFINKVLATWPNAGIVVMSQNPEKSPAANSTPHLLRNLALASYCRTKGVEYLPVIEAFRSLSDGGASLVRSSDGIHPTDATDTADASPGVAATNGAQLWTRVVYAAMKAKSKVSAPLTP